MWPKRYVGINEQQSGFSPLALRLVLSAREKLTMMALYLGTSKVERYTTASLRRRGLIIEKSNVDGLKPERRHCGGRPNVEYELTHKGRIVMDTWKVTDATEADMEKQREKVKANQE